MLRTAGNARHKEGITRKRALAEKIWEMALDGNLQAARLIYEYVDGKPAQRLEHVGAGGGPVIIKGYSVVSPDDWPENEPE
jgi:hypothetical protein